jgi:hypothetical protein
MQKLSQMTNQLLLVLIHLVGFSHGAWINICVVRPLYKSLDIVHQLFLAGDVLVGLRGAFELWLRFPECGLRGPAGSLIYYELVVILVIDILQVYLVGAGAGLVLRALLALTRRLVGRLRVKQELWPTFLWSCGTGGDRALLFLTIERFSPLFKKLAGIAWFDWGSRREVLRYPSNVLRQRLSWKEIAFCLWIPHLLAVNKLLLLLDNKICLINLKCLFICHIPISLLIFVQKGITYSVWELVRHGPLLVFEVFLSNFLLLGRKSESFFMLFHWALL